MTTELEAFRADSDWQEAFGFAGSSGGYNGGSALEVRGGPSAKGTERSFEIDTVVEVLAASEGYYDGDDWLAIVKCQDVNSTYRGGAYAYLFVAAGCDYTGWDCQAQGYAVWSLSLDDLWRWGVGEEHRQRLIDAGFDPSRVVT